MMFPGDTYGVTFDTPGTYSYFCIPHVFMTGVITVTG
jgi:plastocyanin